MNRHTFTLGLSLLLCTPSAQAADLYWDGGTTDITDDGNGASAGGSGTWDTTITNWDAGAAPHVAWNNSNGDTANFAGSGGTVTLATSITLGGLIAHMNNATATNIDIAGSNTLSVNGGVWVGANKTSSTPTKLNLTGSNGTFAVNNSGGTLRVGSTSAFSGARFDMSALGTFTADLGATGYVIVGTDTNWNGNGAGQDSLLTLAQTSTITAGTLAISAHHLASTAVNNTLNLGTGTNTLNIDNISLGPFESSGNISRSNTATLQFLDANGTVTLRAADGTSRANLAIGTVARPYANIVAIADFSGHDSDLLVDALTIGEFTATGTYSGSYPATGTLSFDTGTLDANSVVIGRNIVGNGSATGTLNIDGGMVSIGSGGITIGGTTNGTGTLNFTGGTITMGRDITQVGLSSIATLTLDGATLDMGGYRIGGATAIDTLNILSGTLKNVGEINDGEGLTKTGSGTLTLDGTNTYTGDTTVSDGTLVLADDADLSFVVTDGSANQLIETSTGAVTLDGDFTIDTSAVTVADATWSLANLTNTAYAAAFTSTFTVNGFTPDVDGVTWTRSEGGNLWTFSETNGTLTLGAGSGPSEYDQWATGAPYNLSGADALASADPDKDGVINLIEFALNGDPTNGADNGVATSKILDVGGTPALTLTIATRKSADFGTGTGAPLTSGSIAGITYTIEGGQDLEVWTTSITEVTPSIATGLPDLTGTDYEYHTFKTAGPVSSTPEDFIRVRVTE